MTARAAGSGAGAGLARTKVADADAAALALFQDLAAWTASDVEPDDLVRRVADRLADTAWALDGAVRARVRIARGEDVLLDSGPSPAVGVVASAQRQLADGAVVAVELALTPSDRAPSALPDRQIRVLDTVADLLAGWWARRAAVTQGAQAQAALARAARVRRALVETYAHVLEGDADEAAQRVLDAALDTVAGARLGSVLVRTERDTYRFAAVRGYDAEALTAIELPADGVLFGHDWSNGLPFFVADVAAVNGARAAEHAALAAVAAVSRAAGPAQALVAPVVVDGALVAAIGVERRADDPPFAADAPESVRLYAQGVGALFLRAEREREAGLLGRAVAASSDGLAVVDIPRKAGRPVFRLANPALRKMLGVDDAALATWDVWRALGPGTMARGFAALRRSVRSGAPARLQVALDAEGGPRIWVEVAVSRLAQDRDHVRVLITLRDVTTLRAQLDELQRLNDDLRARLGEARTLEAIDAAITSASERRSTLRRVLTVLAARPGIAQANLYLVRGPADAGDEEPLLEPDAGAPAAVGDGPLPKGVRLAAQSHHEVASDDGAAWNEAATGVGYRALPMFSKGALVGVLEVRLEAGFRPDGPWDRFLRILGAQVAIAVENTTTLARLRDAAEAYAELAAFGGRIEELDDAVELVDEGVRTLLATFGMNGAILYDRVGDGFAPTRYWGVLAEATRARITPLALGEGAVGQAALSGEPVYVERYASWAHASRQTPFADVRSVLGLPVRIGGHVGRGIALLSEGRTVPLRADQVAIARAFVLRLERALERAAVQRQVEATREEAFRALGLALEYRDYETRGHTDRVVAMARRLGERVGLDAPALEALSWGAYLHDIGKIAIPDDILLKPACLDEAERRVVERHALVGDEMTRGLTFLPERSRAVVRAHHERWDGSGYPDGLAGDAIPYLARLFALVDVHDALVSERPYKPAWTDAAARAELRRQAGVRFDPRLTEAMLALLEEDAAG